jgi:hypothetical protein
MVSLVDTIANLDCNNLGTNPIAFVITDSSGNTSSGVFTATVLDTFPPTIQLNDISIYGDTGGNYPDVSFADVDTGSSDNCGTINNDFELRQFTCSDIGVHAIDVVVSDASGNISTGLVAVSVLDTFPPQIICVMDFTVNVCDPVEYFAPITTDNCGAPVPELISGLESGAAFPIGVTEIVYRATDGNGNTSECMFNITVEVDLAIDLQPTDASCFDFSDGSIEYTVSGGTAPYMVNIDPVQQDSLTLHAGKYFVTVDDSQGCSIVDSFEIFQPDLLIITDIQTTNESASPGSDGTIDITVEGGTEDYTFSWTKDGEFFSDLEDLINLNAGEYVCTIIDNNGCIIVSDIIAIEKETSVIDTEFDASINLFPNPNNGNFTVEFDDLSLSSIELSMFTTTGKLVYSSVSDPINGKIEIDQDILSGLYFIRFQSDNKTALKRIIIQE